MYSRSNRNEGRRPYSSQGSYSSRNESRWAGDYNRDRNFSSYNEDEQARDYSLENDRPRHSYSRNENDVRYGTDRYDLSDERHPESMESGRNYNRDFSRSSGRRDFNRNSSRDESRQNLGSYGRNYESSRFSPDRESDSRDYSLQNYSDRDYSGSTNYSGRGYRLREDSYGSGSSRSYAGRGPKSYTRSDERIKEDVCDMLTRHSEIDAQEIEVEVKNGEVTLSGTVPERHMKHMAEDLAENVSSVKDVTNNIRVQKEATRDWSSSDSEMGTSSDVGSISTRGSSTSSSSTGTKRSGSSSSSTKENH